MKKAIIIILIFTSFNCNSYCQELFLNNSSISGYVRGSIFGGSKKYELSSVFAELSLKSVYTQKKVIFFSDLRFRAGSNFGENYKTVDIFELYCGYKADKFEISVGNQIVNWGRTDGFSPSDNISPKDYFFISANPDDQLISNFMLRGKIRFSPASDLEIIAIPIYRSSLYRFDLFDLGENIYFDRAIQPKKNISNGSVGIKWSIDYPRIGVAFSFFRGYDPYCGFRINSITMDPENRAIKISNVSAPYIKNTLCADLVLPLNNWIVRSEFAYNITRNYNSEMYVPNPSLAYVIGIERELFGINTVFQYIGKYSIDFSELENPQQEQILNYEFEQINRRLFNQQKRYNHALSLMLNKSLFSETLSLEFTGYYNITSKEILIRPKLSWKITDNFTSNFGASYMSGPEKSIFGYSKKLLNGCYLELKVNF